LLNAAFRRRLALGSLLSLLFGLCLNDNNASPNIGVTQELHNNNQDLEAALPDGKSLIELFHGFGLHLELLVSLRQIAFVLLLIGLEHVLIIVIQVFALDGLELKVLFIDLLDGIEQGTHDPVIVEYWHQVANALLLLLLDHESYAVDGKNARLNESRVVEHVVDQRDRRIPQKLWAEVHQLCDELEVETQVLDFVFELLFHCEVLGGLRLKDFHHRDDGINQ